MATATSSSIDHSHARGDSIISNRYESLPSAFDDIDPAAHPANGHTNDYGIAPLHLPAAVPAYRSPQQDRSVLPDGKHTLSGISVRAFGLGIGLGVGFCGTIWLAIQGSALWRAPFFVMALTVFDFLEFWVTSAYNTPLATPDAFLLTGNGWAYNFAHMSASLETVVMNSGIFNYDFDPRTIWSLKLEAANGAATTSDPWSLFANMRLVWTALGFGLVVGGQIIRSMAMMTAGRNFNHTVQTRRQQEHELVTNGIYAYLRHPSYFGFFWWAMGTQMVLGNAVCLAVYAVALWTFFSERVRKEEALLLRFFDKEYADYRGRTIVGIPGIR